MISFLFSFHRSHLLHGIRWCFEDPQGTPGQSESQFSDITLWRHPSTGQHAYVVFFSKVGRGQRMRVAVPYLLLPLELSNTLGLHKKPRIESNECTVNDVFPLRLSFLAFRQHSFLPALYLHLFQMEHNSGEKRRVGLWPRGNGAVFQHSCVEPESSHIIIVSSLALII